MMNDAIAKPTPSEYLPYYGRYVSLVPDANILTVLADQITETLDVLRSIPDSRANFRYAPEKWSIKELVGHLIDSERVFAYRALRFARNDSTPLPGFEQDDYVRGASYDRLPLSDIAAEFQSVRESTLCLFKNLEEEAWLRQGKANDAEVSVRALAYIIAGHELHHRGVLRAKYLEAPARAQS